MQFKGTSYVKSVTDQTWSSWNRFCLQTPLQLQRGQWHPLFPGVQHEEWRDG